MGPTNVTEHYASGELRARIEAALAAIDGPVSVGALGPVDEFHIGGRPATAHLAQVAGIAADMRVLDCGSGLGGTARFLASEIGATVHGVDLTPEYVETARWLTELVELGDRVTFDVGSVTDLDPSGPRFDAATMLHVGMNIEDKHALARSVHARLEPGSPFAVYDVMATSDTSWIGYPVPWAAAAETSFLAAPTDYGDALRAAGFEIETLQDRSDQALAFFERAAAAPPDAPPPLGLHLVMGPETPVRIGNMVSALRARQIAPTLIVARRR